MTQAINTNKKIISILGLSFIASAVGYTAFDSMQLERSNAAKKQTATSLEKTMVSQNVTPVDSGLGKKVFMIDKPTKGPLTMDDLKHIQLTDQDGDTFSLNELKGETLLVNFMFAGCTTICPAQTASLRRVHNEMLLDPVTDRIKMISISIAPLSDTPKQLKQFAQRFEIDKPSWRFAVTSQANTAEISKQFGVGVKKLEGGQLDHRSTLYLINHNGVMIQQYRGDLVDIERLKKELRIVDQLDRS